MEILEKIMFSALLHDIGKVVQRAEKGNENHSIQGVNFLKSFENNYLKDNDVLDSIKYHHATAMKDANLKPSHIGYIIYEADNIASGSDRTEDLEKNNLEKRFDKTLCLSAVFNKIGEVSNYIYHLRDFNEKKEINYPINDSQIYATQNLYQDLLKVLKDNLNNIDSINSLLQLLESTTSFIPSSTNTSEVADISLYDHLKLTTAISSCMYNYFEENNIKDFKSYCFPNNKEKREECRSLAYFKLVSFDLSGIQDFIYTISSSNALKLLRAKSFYLEFLMEHICNELLSLLGLSNSNILYTGGGHCYLLLPNTKHVEQAIKQLQIQVNDWFLEHFAISLYLAVGTTTCTSNDLMNNSGDIFARVSKNISTDKLKRYTKNQLNKIFDIEYQKSRIVEKSRECKICKTSSKDLDNNGVCQLCTTFIELGKYITGKDNLVIITSKEQKKYSVELPTLDNGKKYLSLKIIPNTISSEQLNNLIEDEKCENIYTINKWSTGNNKYIKNIWLGNYNCKPSIEFSQLSEESNGIKRLGVMRADVDNLGTVFSKGLPKEYSSISRIATLSRQLNMFFKYYINKLCKNYNIVIVYSGGDDVFIVGSWNDVIKFTKELRIAFGKYTCNKLTFSAGIGFFNPSYPVYKMAEQTGLLEEFAKNSSNKDSIALFGEGTNIKGINIEKLKFVYNWKEFDYIEQTIDKIKAICYFKEQDKEANKIMFSTSIMYKLLNLINSEDNINLARFAYTIARLEPQKDELLKEKFIELKNLLYNLYKNEKLKLLAILNLIIYEKRN